MSVKEPLISMVPQSPANHIVVKKGAVGGPEVFNDPIAVLDTDSRMVAW